MGYNKIIYMDKNKNNFLKVDLIVIKFNLILWF